ncbi:MAG TPA: hypothetical protein RMH99_24895, partial [Sandaracinaceae bacterium LLY-WYZ-13_1]|nr:hypothetical protein [Sandaracinaceae bacterium LLY-WYZ-13_1]
HPIAGGMESATSRRLSRRARRANRNDFRVRFIAQHRWRGALRCENPRRGRWGGHVRGGSYGPSATQPWPDDRDIPLGAWIRDDVPAAGVRRR